MFKRCSDWSRPLSLLATGCLALGTLGCKPEAEVERDRLAAEQNAAVAAQGDAPFQAQKAETGVTGKGKSLDDVSDYNPVKFISGPASAFLKTKERVFFEIQLPKSLQLFQATHGRVPKSHEEFMQEVMAPPMKMPDLPQGLQYRYRPDLGELWVEPIQNNAGPESP
ncbi:hypothetical protein VN12_22235 [Pirellula sp. SH-Sr6A]|uniref:hypothetical protein n=1 Tax=Pirellula sp. SH-Sr6A TaxID=1632865 RepID=UPI00078C2CB4|nr:hypothetical protein [Pirellula sp. SH-Sr6A]AMV34862.1 hypothetical protein VN12_22235 [Pirellula sp. SH-Sr6A]